MKKVFYLFTLVVILISCKEEKVAPTAFIEYSKPYAENMDESLLIQLDQTIKQGVYGNIYSLIILKSGKIVFENYYSNTSRDDLHPLGGATQSIVSAVVGTQELNDEEFSLSSKIIDYYPEYAQYFDNIPQKDQIEIRHLLSHTSGFWWDELGYPFGTEENDAYNMSLSDDWVAHVLATPMIKEPGYGFNFNSGNAILMAPIMEKETGEAFEELTKKRLFDPLAITNWEWDRTSKGRVNTAWGLHLKAIDMAKIGYLYLNNGTWQDQLLFDDIWRTRSTRGRNAVSNYFNYGYYWWSFNNRADAVIFLSRNDVFFAWGEGGQFIFVVPHLDLVVVTTGGNFNANDTKSIEILRDYIFPAVMDRYP